MEQFFKHQDNLNLIKNYLYVNLDFFYPHNLYVFSVPEDTKHFMEDGEPVNKIKIGGSVIYKTLTLLSKCLNQTDFILQKTKASENKFEGNAFTEMGRQTETWLSKSPNDLIKQKFGNAEYCGNETNQIFIKKIYPNYIFEVKASPDIKILNEMNEIIGFSELKTSTNDIFLSKISYDYTAQFLFYLGFLLTQTNPGITIFEEFHNISNFYSSFNLINFKKADDNLINWHQNLAIFQSKLLNIIGCIFYHTSIAVLHQALEEKDADFGKISFKAFQLTELVKQTRNIYFKEIHLKDKIISTKIIGDEHDLYNYINQALLCKRRKVDASFSTGNSR